MYVTILGTRGNIERSARGHSNHSGILVDDDILLDAGEKKYLHEYHPRFVLITHLHSDHVAIHSDDVPEGTVVYAPEPSPRLPMIRIASRPVHLGPYVVTPIPTIHSQRVKSVGYVVERRAERFLYTSDLVGIEPRFYRLLEGLDMVITEGSFIRSKGLIRSDETTGLPTGHNGIPDLVALFSRFTKRIVITHFGTWFFKNITRSRQRIELLGNGVRVMAARDGMRLRVGSNVSHLRPRK